MTTTAGEACSPELARLLVEVEGRGITGVNVAQLLWLVHREGVPFAALRASLDAQGAALLVGCALRFPPEVADALLERIWSDLELDAALAGAAQLAARLSTERALVWSSRLRGRGLSEHCPLVAMAREAGALPSARVRAGAVAWRAFSDGAGRAAALTALAELANPEVAAAARVELAVLAPDLLAEAEPELARAETAFPACTQALVTVVVSDGPAAEATCAIVGEVTAPGSYEISLGGPGALSETAAEYLLFLADGVVPRRGWHDALVAAFREAEDVAVVVPTVEWSSGQAHGGCQIIGDARYEPTLSLVRRMLVPDAPTQHLIQAASSEALAVRTGLFAQVGGFDTLLPAAEAAADLCLRVASAGYRVVHAPACRTSWRDGPSPASAEDPAGRALFDARWLGVVGPDRSIGFVARQVDDVGAASPA